MSRQRLRVRTGACFLLLWLPLLVACEAPPTPRPTVRITLTGSDSMVLLARELGDAYSQQRPEVTFTVQGANSEVGMRAVHEGGRTIGLVSRTIKPSELDRTRAVVVARDGIAIIVNQKNPINAIMRSQITQVFSGQILTWPAGPNAGQSILVVSREEGSGTRNAFEAMVMNNQRVTPTAVVMPGEAAVVDFVTRHPESIAYVSMSAMTSDVRPLMVDDVQLSPQMVESQTYPFVRTLAFLVPLDGDPALQEFVNFATGPDGQAIVGRHYGRAP